MAVATTPLLSITDDAVKQLKEFLDEQGTPDHALRVFVAPGGCSGLQYGMTIEEAQDEGDEVIETEGVKIIVDNFSAMLTETFRRRAFATAYAACDTYF